MIDLYGLSHCTTCKKAIKFLNMNDVTVNEIDIRENPPKKALIELALAGTAGNPRKIMNTSGEMYREMGLKDKLATMSHEELVDLLSTHGMLLKRPFITDSKQTTNGAKEDILEAAWFN